MYVLLNPQAIVLQSGASIYSVVVKISFEKNM